VFFCFGAAERTALANFAGETQCKILRA